MNKLIIAFLAAGGGTASIAATPMATVQVSPINVTATLPARVAMLQTELRALQSQLATLQTQTIRYGSSDQPDVPRGG